ncbi:UNVERIFIED_CONTAM: hypothetical protein Sindi_0845800 [Sesamum indicum]
MLRPKDIIRISGIPQEHQLFWINNLKSYWWDYEEESMFKIIKSQVAKFLWKRFTEAQNGLTAVAGREDLAPAFGVLGKPEF